MTYSLSQPFSYQGASYNRLTADWRITITDPNVDWTSEWRDLAARAADLIRNDPVIAALVNARLSGTHGPSGLRFRSLYGADILGLAEPIDPKQAAKDPNLKTRSAIDSEIARCSHGVQLDANGILHRKELEEALDWMAVVYGDCFAVRKYIPNRPGARLSTCWMILPPWRVMNPPGKTNSESLYEGITMDKNSAPDGIFVAPAIRQTIKKEGDNYQWIPWYGPDGSRNIIHRTGFRPPGSYRGVSSLSQMMWSAKQTKGVIEAYVVGKRIQASHPIFIECEDPIEAAKKDRNGAVWGPNTTIEPGKVYYVGHNSGVHFPTWNFNGSDMKEFLDVLYRNQFAAWGFPLCVVLGQMSSGSNQAARSDWMQYYDSCRKYQDCHIEQVSKVIDESIIRESIARDVLPALDGDMHDIMRGRYIRPPRTMPEPLKEAQAIQAWLAIGRDYTGAYAESGLEFRDCIVQRAQDDALIKSHGVNATPTAPPPGNGARQGEDDANQEGEPSDDDGEQDDENEDDGGDNGQGK